MNRKHVPAGSLLAVLLVAVAPRLQGQATPATSPEQATPEETVVLSPFVVDAAEDADSYSAKATLAGSRIRTELRDVGSAISVVTQKFLEDTNSKNATDLLVYTTGTEVAGQGGNFTGGGDGAIINDGSFVQPVANTRVRGLAQADNLRDFFLTDIPWDSYNVGRIDLQRGANSILFGIGSPAGIINSSVNAASFNDSNKIEFQVASFGTTRAVIDVNKSLVEDELAVRLSLLRDDTNYRQKPAFRDDHRFYAAMRWDPRFLAAEGANTSFQANYETGKINGINPRLTPPIDAITPWFGPMNKFTTPWLNANQLTDRGNVARYNPYVGAAGSRIWDGQVITFDSPSSTSQSGAFAASVYNFPGSNDTADNDQSNGSYKGILTYNNIAFNLRQPGYAIAPFKAKSLTDDSVFDFYNNLIEGENRTNDSEFTAYNFNLTQTLFNGKLGFKLEYDHQDTDWSWKNFLAWDAAAITVDIMETLIDGSPNPNVGRPMIIGGGGSAGSGKQNSVRETVRGTIYGEFNFKDLLESNETMARILGRHMLTFSGTEYTRDAESTGWNNWYVGDGYAQTASSAVGQASRDATTVTYLGPSLLGASSASGLDLGRLTAIQEATSASVVNWNTDTLSYQSYALPIVNPNADSFTDETRPYTNARHFRDKISSQVFVWQGWLFDGALVPMVGWRNDDAENFDAGPPNKTGGIVSNYNDPNWRLPSGQSENGTGTYGERVYNFVSGQTNTWSIVGHVPRSWADRLPGGLGLSVFYNRSENFQPDAARRDIVGGFIPSPTGRTKDYGIQISAFDGKYSLKINKYETEVTNATLSGDLANSYLIGAGENWGNVWARRIYREIHGIAPGFDATGDNYGTTDASSPYGAGKILRWQPSDTGNLVNDRGPDGIGGNGDDRAPGTDGYTNTYSQQAINEQYDDMVKSVEAWVANPIPESMMRAWGMTPQTWENGIDQWSGNAVAVTGDTLSKGTEYEFIASPVDGLEVGFNASKTDARRLSIGKAYSDWIEVRYAQYSAGNVGERLGDMRMWGGGNWAIPDGSGGRVIDKFNNETYPAYQLALALNNSNVPELRPWRFNAFGNYSFKQGRLRGANVGASYRWQDKNVTGFRLNAAGDGYDVNDPWYGPKEDALDLWFGYQRKLFSDRINWRVQLNIRDVLASDDLIPVTVQPDGSPGAFRIPAPRVFTLSNSFEF